jgi:hypothetical protein
MNIVQLIWRVTQKAENGWKENINGDQVHWTKKIEERKSRGLSKEWKRKRDA